MSAKPSAQRLKVVAPPKSPELSPEMVALKVENDLRARGLWQIVEDVAKAHYVLPVEVVGRGLTPTVTRARREAMRQIRQLTGMSTTELARIFGRDHSTVSVATNAQARVLKTAQEAEREAKKKQAVARRSVIADLARGILSRGETESKDAERLARLALEEIGEEP